MEKTNKDKSTQDLDKTSPSTDENRANNSNNTLIDVTNGKDSLAKHSFNTQTTTKNFNNKPIKSNSIDKENTENISSQQQNRPGIDVSKLSGIKKKRASFFTKQFSSFDGSSPIERFQSAIASAASVFSSSVGSSQTTTVSSNENTSQHIAPLSSNNPSQVISKLPSSLKGNNEASQEEISTASIKPSNVIPENNQEKDVVTSSVADLLSSSTGAKSKTSKKGKKSKKDGKKGSSFLRRSGSHSPSIRRSPTKTVTEGGSSCINLSVSDRSGPSSGNTTPSPRSFRRSAEPPEFNRGREDLRNASSNQAVRTTANTLTVPTSGSVYGAIPRTTINSQSQSTPASEDDPPRRCFCGHYTEVKLDNCCLLLTRLISNLKNN